MTLPGSVVPETVDVTEAEFRAALLSGLARCEKAKGTRALASAMDLSTKQLGNIQTKGAMPAPKRTWDALNVCPTALDDVAALYRKKLVDDDGVATAAPGTLPIAALLAEVAKAESPDSPGGVAKTHQELLAMETQIRAVHALTGSWIEQINAIRAPRAVA